MRFKRKNGVQNPILKELISKRGWGINNDREKGSYIDHFECLVCQRLHQNLAIKKGEKKLKWVAKKEHLGCPPPYTFNKEGILLNRKNESGFEESTFLTSYQLDYIKQKLFFEKYYNKNYSNLSYKKLFEETLNYHRKIFIKEKEKIDLKK